MAVINKANLDAANRSFYTKINQTIGTRPPGSWSQFTDVLPADGTNFDVLVAETDRGIREWIGAKQYGHLKTYRQNHEIRKWEKTVAVPVDEFNGDRTGIVVDRINRMVDDAATVYDKITIDELLGNPTGYDGVSLLSNSHPNQVSGGTSDNLGAALTFAEYKNGREALLDMKAEDGEPLQMVPSHLMVGPELERLAMEITGSDRPVALGTNGDQDATSGVQSAVLLQNFIGGGVTLIVNPRITDDAWFLMDLTKPSKPMILGEFQAPTGVTLNDPTDVNVFERDELVWSVTAKATPVAGDWHTVYGFDGT